MDRPLPILDRVRIASPCNKAWASMSGDERVRYCDACELNVYNLSAMTREEAEALIVEKEGKLCATYFSRSDGTVLTRDCPVGLIQQGKRHAKRMAGLAAWLIVALLLAAGSGFARATGQRAHIRQMQPFAKLIDWLGGKAATPVVIMPRGRMVIMGKVACPSAPGKLRPAPTMKFSDGADQDRPPSNTSQVIETRPETLPLEFPAESQIGGIVVDVTDLANPDTPGRRN